jgi:hypothetical protein
VLTGGRWRSIARRRRGRRGSGLPRAASREQGRRLQWAGRAPPPTAALLERLDGGVSGKLCAGKRFVGVSRGKGALGWREKRPGEASRGRLPPCSYAGDYGSPSLSTARGREEQRFRARGWSGEGVQWCEGVERLGEGLL